MPVHLTAADTVVLEKRVKDGEYPYVFAPNEGFFITNRVLLGAAAGSSVYIDLSWTEVSKF